MTKKITSEEEYQKSINWLVEKAKEIENPHPLASEEDRMKLAATYTFVEKMIQAYHDEWFADKYYPPLHEEKEDPVVTVNVDDWL